MRGHLIAAADLNADGAVKASEGYFWGLVLFGGSAASSIVLHDNAAAASGSVIARLNVAAAASGVLILPHPVKVQNGIFANIEGLGAAATVYFE